MLKVALLVHCCLMTVDANLKYYKPIGNIARVLRLHFLLFSVLRRLSSAPNDRISGLEQHHLRSEHHG